VGSRCAAGGSWCRSLRDGRASIAHCNPLQHATTHCHALIATLSHALPRSAARCHLLSRTATSLYHQVLLRRPVTYHFHCLLVTTLTLLTAQCSLITAHYSLRTCSHFSLLTVLTTRYAFLTSNFSLLTAHWALRIPDCSSLTTSQQSLLHVTLLTTQCRSSPNMSLHLRATSHLLTTALHG
jgi:hypothetical protein